MYDNLDAYMLLKSRNSAFLGNFQKLPGGWWTTARRLICFMLVLGFWEGNRLAAHWECAARRRLGFTPVLGFWMKGLAGLIQPPGDASEMAWFLCFWGFGRFPIGGKSVIIIELWSHVKNTVDCRVIEVNWMK